MLERVLGGVARKVAGEVVPKYRHLALVADGRDENLGDEVRKDFVICVVGVHPPGDDAVERVDGKQEVAATRDLGRLVKKKKIHWYIHVRAQPRLGLAARGPSSGRTR